MRINEQNYVDEAEKVIIFLKNEQDKNARSEQLVTTTKLRNLLAMSADIYNEVVNQKEDTLSEDVCARIEYLRVRMLYEAGRDPSVRKFVDKAELVKVLKEINGSRKKYILFNRYMEALVAFRKFHVEKDD